MKLIQRAAVALLLCTATLSTLAAEPLRSNYEALAKSAEYAAAMQKFVDGQNLSTVDAQLVYYGSACQPGFNASASYPAMLSAYNDNQMDRAFELCQNALKVDPTNLAVLFKAYASAMASTKAENRALAPKMQARLLNVCDAIFESGKGVSEFSPYVVIRPDDINEFVVKYIQPEIVMGSATVGGNRAIKVKLPGIADEAILYFHQF